MRSEETKISWPNCSRAKRGRYRPEVIDRKFYPPLICSLCSQINLGGINLAEGRLKFVIQVFSKPCITAKFSVPVAQMDRVPASGAGSGSSTLPGDAKVRLKGDSAGSPWQIVSSKLSVLSLAFLKKINFLSKNSLKNLSGQDPTNDRKKRCRFLPGDAKVP